MRWPPKGIEAEVVDPRTLVPLDKAAIIASVKKTGRLVVVHEAVKRGGFGGEIASMIAEEAFDYLDAPIKRVAGQKRPHRVQRDAGEEGCSFRRRHRRRRAVADPVGFHRRQPRQVWYGGSGGIVAPYSFRFTRKIYLDI